MLDFAEILLAPDESAADVGIPLDLRPPSAGAPGPRRRRTATERALMKIQLETASGWPSAAFRGRGRDDLSKPGRFELPALEDQMPDVADVCSKTFDYCLDPLQKDRKHVGFERIGFQHTKQHARLLSYQLISAVLHRDVVVIEPSVNAHGELLFALDSKVIGPRGKHAAVHSAWQQQRRGGLRLLTAWTTDATKAGPLSPSYDPPGHIADDDYSAILHEAARVAREAGREIGSDFGMAFGWLLVPNTQESKAFRRWLRGEQNAPVIFRSHLGGRCTVLGLEAGLTHRDQLATGLANAAMVLGLFDIDAVPALSWN